jgi:ABC-type transport system involved in multi-copper enzyme maturation permease subunit
VKSLVIARLTFQEAIRKKVLLGAVLLTMGYLGLFGVGCYFAFKDMRQGLSPQVYDVAVSQLLLLGLYGANFMGGLLAIFSSVGTISSDVEQGVLHAIVPRALHRWEIVLGKWLGCAAMLFTYVFFLGWAVIGIVACFGNYLPSGALVGVSLMGFQALLILSLCFLGSTLFSTITNGVVVLILYACAMIGGQVEQLGSLLRNETLVNIGIGVGLLIPSDTLWKLASYLLQPQVPSLFGTVGPFQMAAPPSLWTLAYAFLYSAAALSGAILVFQRRDL